jgi:cytosine/uracil/thiamine/allantoin permease
VQWREIRLNTVGKIGVLAMGVLTVLPLAYVAYFLLAVAALALDASLPPPTIHLGVAHICFSGLVVLLVPAYVIHLFRNNAVPTEKKPLWAVVLFCGSIVAMPVYWYLHMWRRCPAPPPFPAD